MELDALTRLLARRQPGLMDATGRYAVLVPMVKGEEGPVPLYEVRAHTLRRQPGRCAFPAAGLRGRVPGGMCPARNGGGIVHPRSAVRVLGRLDFIAHRANFIMYPVLALVDRRARENVPKLGGGGGAFLVPLRHLLAPPSMTISLLIPRRENLPPNWWASRRIPRWQQEGKERPHHLPEGNIWGLPPRSPAIWSALSPLSV